MKKLLCLTNYISKKKKKLTRHVFFYFYIIFIAESNTHNDTNNGHPHYAIADTIQFILASLSTSLFSSISHATITRNNIVTHKFNYCTVNYLEFLFLDNINYCTPFVNLTYWHDLHFTGRIVYVTFFPL